MARLLSAFKVQVDVIVSSPLKRALQTAQFVGTELGYEGKVEVSPALGMDASFARFPAAAGEVRRSRGRAGGGAQSQSLSVPGPADDRQRRRRPAHAQRLHRAHRSATGIRRCCNGSSIRAWRAPSMPAWQRARGRRPRESNPPLCAATTAQAPLRFAPAPLRGKSAWDKAWRNAQHVAGSILVQRHGQPQQHHCAMHVLVLLGGNIAHGAVAGLRAALAQVARDGRDQGALQLVVAVDLRARNDVLRVPVVALVVDELAGIAQQRRRRSASFHTRRAARAAAFSSRKSCSAWARTGSACAEIDAVAPRRGQHALPALVLELAMDLWRAHPARPASAPGCRRASPAANSENRQVKALQHLGKDLRAGDDDLRAARADAGHRFALGQGHAGHLAGQFADRRAFATKPCARAARSPEALASRFSGRLRGHLA